MPKVKSDYSNPRDVIGLIHKVIVSQKDWSEGDKKGYQRWIKRKTINKKMDQDWFDRLFKEILNEIISWFPIKTEDSMNFTSSLEHNKYAGQLFTFLIWNPFSFVLKPLFISWLREDETVEEEKRARITSDKLKELLIAMNQFERRNNDSKMNNKMQLVALFDEGWYLPSRVSKSDMRRADDFILPSARMFDRFDILIGKSPIELLDEGNFCTETYKQFSTKFKRLI